MPDGQHAKGQEDEGIQPHGVSQVRCRPERPRVAQGERGAEHARKTEPPAKVIRGGELDAPELQGNQHKGEERQVILVEEEDDQVERACQIVAVESPRVGAQAARRRVEDGLLPRQHAAEPRKEVHVLKGQILDQKRLVPKRVDPPQRGNKTEDGNGRQKTARPEQDGPQARRTRCSKH